MTTTKPDAKPIDDVEINTATVQEMLANVQRELVRLDGLHIARDHRNPTGTQANANARSQAAEVTRTLLFLHHTLTMAASLVNNEYWAARGHDTGVYGVMEDQT